MPGEVHKTAEAFSYIGEIRDGREPYFDLELWFLASFQGKPVWALNREHLAYLIGYLSADQMCIRDSRPLKRYEIPASKLVLELGYSVDYEDEKENFEPDEADTVELINGERMPWEQAKRCLLYTSRCV